MIKMFGNFERERHSLYILFINCKTPLQFKFYSFEQKFELQNIQYWRRRKITFIAWLTLILH